MIRIEFTKDERIKFTTKSGSDTFSKYPRQYQANEEGWSK